MISNFNKVYRKIKKVCVTHKNVALDKLSSIKIGGIAKMVCYPTTIEQIVKIMDTISDYQIKYLIVGNCTNLLFGDFDGVIIKIASNFSTIEVCNNSIIAYAGCSLSAVACVARDNNLSGMEGLYGIPGTVGGAVVMNAGAFNTDMSKVVSSVLAIKDGKITYYDYDACKFAYRSSAFENCLILRVQFDLKPGNYQDIDSAMKSNMQLRLNTQPLNMPSLGCTWRNTDNLVVGKVLDQDGFKGRSVGGAIISNKHANFIVNSGGATLQDVLDLMQQVKSYIWARYGVSLTPEIKVINHKE